MSPTTIKVYRDLMEKNAAWADMTRRLAAKKHVAILNLIGSPGCGKTTLLEGMVRELGPHFRFAVLEGDVETTRDAERLDALRIPVCQLITSGACHLSAQLVHTAFRDLPLDDLDVVIVENVGNLVCPAGFDIGEAAKVAVLSLTEGEDKPVKYPQLFHEAGAVVMTKIDLLPHIPADLDTCIAAVRQVNGAVPVFPVCALDGRGLPPWIAWIERLATQTRGKDR
ncbi:MAG: hydrogenase nickel incorporation protein HypB [Kiritimatiellaeota bacterium]|nr:hydrogenase nickel incorporation protein HypB [Kiritimatiellota bacterium]